jgi:hypothetical protein
LRRAAETGQFRTFSDTAHLAAAAAELLVETIGQRGKFWEILRNGPPSQIVKERHGRTQKSVAETHISAPPPLTEALRI